MCFQVKTGMSDATFTDKSGFDEKPPDNPVCRWCIDRAEAQSHSNITVYGLVDTGYIKPDDGQQPGKPSWPARI